MKLKDRVAIVTGAAQGIGRAYALRLAQEGAKVVMADILDAKGVQQEIEIKGGEALALQIDVSDEKSTTQMAQKTIERFEKIDILINNAAIFGTIVKKPFHEISPLEWDDVIGVNLKGTFLCCKAVYPHMKEQRKGKIINVSSTTFFEGIPFFLHYVTSKGGIIGFTRALAREVGDDGICVNAVAPGLTLSEAVFEDPKYSTEYLKRASSGRCFKRDEQPENLTGTIVFLASDDSDFITGQTIVVDGGATLH